MLDFARMSGAVHGLLDAETVKTCDLLLLAIPPQAAHEIRSLPGILRVSRYTPEQEVPQ